jgi:hypothetical protein
VAQIEREFELPVSSSTTHVKPTASNNKIRKSNRVKHILLQHKNCSIHTTSRIRIPRNQMQLFRLMAIATSRTSIYHCQKSGKLFCSLAITSRHRGGSGSPCASHDVHAPVCVLVEGLGVSLSSTGEHTCNPGKFSTYTLLLKERQYWHDTRVILRCSSCRMDSCDLVSHNCSSGIRYETIDYWQTQSTDYELPMEVEIDFSELACSVQGWLTCKYYTII